MPLRWGVLGGSSRIYRKSLKPALLASGHTIVAEASRAGDSLAAYDAMLTRSDIDAVYNPLPNHLHATWTHRALEAGKHVLCEKPLTLSVADTIAVCEHAEAAGRVVLEAYMWPHHPRARRLLSLVASGEVGTPQSGHGAFSWPMNLSSDDHRLDPRGAGALFDVGIYCIAPFMMMAGHHPVRVAANAVRNSAQIDTSMTGWIDWGDGFGSSFHVSFDAPVHRTMALTTSDAVITLPGAHVPGALEPSELCVERKDGSIARIACAGGDAFAGLVEHFADVVAGDAVPVFGREESVRLAGVLEALQRASG